MGPQVADQPALLPSNAGSLSTEHAPRGARSPQPTHALHADTDSRGPVVMLPCPGNASAQAHRDVRGSRSDWVTGAA